MFWKQATAAAEKRSFTGFVSINSVQVIINRSGLDFVQITKDAGYEVRSFALAL